jgi:hypothetical protein
MTLTAAYTEIDEIINSDEKKPVAHPFTVGEQFNVKRYVHERVGMTGIKSKTVTVVYEIIKVSDTTIRLKEIGSDEKPITRKPCKAFNDGEWRFSIDDIYGNTFYKKA